MSTDFLETVKPLLKAVLHELPPGGKITCSILHGSIEHPQFEALIGPKRKLVTMFLQPTLGVHVMCPPPLLEQLGYRLHENPDRDGDQKVLWQTHEAIDKAIQLGKDLRSLLKES